jgi:glutamine synthetase
MMTVLMESGIEVEVGHHEVATAGQCELGMKFSTLTGAWPTAHVVQIRGQERRQAERQDRDVHAEAPLRRQRQRHALHQSLWKEGKPLFAGDGYAGLSDMGLFYIGGILKHAKALAALTNPTTNSYRRLVPGYEAPVNLAYSSRNRSASIRIPVGNSPKARRIEVRFPDATCNPYLAFRAMMMAGLDGIQNRIDPGDPLDKDIYALSPEELKEVPHMPGGLDEALARPREGSRVPPQGRRLHARPPRDVDPSSSARRSSTPCASAPCPTSSSSTTTSDRPRRRRALAVGRPRGGVVRERAD